MLKRLFLCLAITTGFSLAQVPAPSPAVPVTVFLSPFLMTGDYKPVTQDQLNQTLQEVVKQVAPDVQLTVGPTPSRALTDLDALKAARAANCRLALYGTVEFSTQNLTLNAAGGPGPAGYPDGGAIPAGGTYRYLVTVKGNADVKLLDVKSGNTLVDQPESLWRSQTTQAPLDTEAYDDVEEALAKDCVNQLSHRLVQHIKQKAPKL